MEEIALKLSFLHARDASVDRRCRPRPDRKVNLCNLLENDAEDEDAPMKDDEPSESAALTEGALVYLRIRPVPASKFCPFYKIQGKELITHHPEGAAKNIERHFSFNNVFDENVDQPSIYNNCFRSKIEAEKDMTVLAYGTSGSGKTFTLLGDLKDPGIIPRALENLFKIHSNNIYPQPSVKIVIGVLTVLNDDCIKAEEITRNLLLSQTTDVAQLHSVLQKKIENEHNFEVIDTPNKSVFIWISFAEIYNEIVFDLLSPQNLSENKRKGVKIVSNQEKVLIKNLTAVYVKSSIEAYKLLTYGLKQITYASTAVNANSSRSHCIFFVDIITFSHPDIFTQTYYKFCDLAGSERLAKTNNVGSRLKEAQRINSSLMVLGRCMEAAYNNQQKKISDLIPFRESKLTFLLKSALTGKEKLTMIVNITPTEQFFDENLNVLGFASIAKSIAYKFPEKPCCTRYSWLLSHSSRTSPSEIGNDGYYHKLLEEIAQLKAENEELRSLNQHLSSEIIIFKDQLYQQECKLRKDLADDFQKMLTSNNNSWEQRLAQARAALIKVYEAKMNSLEVRYKRKIQELESRYCELSESSIDEDLVVKRESSDIN